MVVAQRKIKRAKITHISLCRRGVNHLPVLMKSSGRVQIEMLTKAAKEGIVYSLIYLPDVPDQEGDVASREVIKAMAHDFLANAAEVNGGIDIEHNFKVLGPEQVRIAETFIVQKGDPRFEGWKDNSGNPVNPEGSWGMALKVLDPTLRAEFENGTLNGVSMFGHADTEMIGKSMPDSSDTNDKPMTPQETAALAAEIVKALKTSEPVTPPVAIEFEGDITSEADLQKHEDKLFLASLDLAKASDVAKLRKHVAKRKAEAEQLAKSAQGQGPEAEKIAKLEAELAELRKASGAPPVGENKDGAKPDQNSPLKKSEADQMAAARKAMRHVMGKLGVACRGK